MAGSLNAKSNLSNVSISAHFKCLTTLKTAGVPCLTPSDTVANTTPTINAVTVTQKAAVPSYFARLFGVTSFNISATATAVPGGGIPSPANVVLVLDTTASMGTADNNCTVPGIGTPTREQCALYAVRTLLNGLDPCPVGLTSCGTAKNGSVSKPIDQVSLMVFPGLTPQQTGTLDNPPKQAPTANVDYQCPGGSPRITSYNANPGYMILPYQSDYRTSDSAAGLNTASSLVIASGGSSCSKGLSDPGGEGTFYAGVIDSAQSYIAQNTTANVKNVMILLSDGDANSQAKLGGTATSWTSATDGGECHAAIAEANAAKKAGTTIYTVAYGAAATGCDTDTGKYAITPCATMQQIASNANTFFGDATGSDTSCTNAARPISSLSDAFAGIASDLGGARLILNSTT